MSALSAVDVARSWDKAAQKPDFAAAIHPSGVEPGAYNESGRFHADQIRECVDVHGVGIGSLLDFGCGNGRVARHLTGDFEVCGADASPSMLAKLAADAPGVTPVLWDGLAETELPGVFDCCYSWAVFIHLTPRDGAQVLENLAASIRPGGLVLIDVPLYDAARTRSAWSDVTVWTPAMFYRAADVASLVVLEMASDPGVFSFDNVGVNHSRLKVMQKS